MKPSSDKKTSVFLDRDLSHAEAQRRGVCVGRKERIDRKDWKCIKVGEFELHRNNTCSRSLMTSDNGKIQNIHYGDILVKFNEIISLEQTKIDYLTSDGEDCAPKDYIQNGDIVIADTAEDETVGKMIEVQDVGQHKVVAGLHTIFYRPPSNLFARGWLGYWMNSTAYHSQLNQYMTGIKVLSLSKSCLANTLIQYPPKKEQQQIVAALDSVQRHITSLQALVAKYDAVKKATVNLLLKPKDNWPVVALGTICEVCSTRRVHESDWTNTGVPFYRARELVALNEGREISPLHISEKLYAECVASSGEIQAGDLLVTGVGSIGVPYLVKRGDRFYFKDGNVIWFKNRGKLHPKYFLHVFKSAYIQNQIEEMSCVGTVGSYTITNGKQTLIPLPPVCEQEQIVTILDSIDNTLKSLKAQLEKSQAIKQGIMAFFFG